MRCLFKTWLLLSGLACLCGSFAFGQWRIQDINLNAGWNAVHIDVAPEPQECEKIFAGMQIESVWKWNKRFSSTEFNIDPGTLLPDDPHWLVWFPPDSDKSFLTRLFNISAGSTYLIKIKDGTSSFIWSFYGRARVVQPEWVPNSLNLVGFSVDPASPPYFSDFFNFTEEIDTTLGFNNELYKVDTSGKNIKIVVPARDKIDRNAAYWVKCKFPLKYSSALGVRDGEALDFKDYIDEQSLVLKNVSTVDTLDVSVKEVSSLNTPSSSDLPENAGFVPLAYYSYNSESNFWFWQNIAENELLTNSLLPGEEWELKFAVRRNNMFPYTPLGTNGYSYQSILEVKCSDPATLYYVPVTASPVGSSNVVEETASKDKGLWVGDAQLYQVNCPAYFTSNITVEVISTNDESGIISTNMETITVPATNMLPTDSVCKMRLIMHIDTTGTARLMQEVFMATISLDEDRSEYRLYSDKKDIPIDATDISRISSVAFPFMAPVILTGSITNGMTGTVTVGCNDPVNPFLHRYNPLHDNKDWDYNQYTNAVETLTVTRNIIFDFSSGTSSNVVDNPFWGNSTQGGVYKETIIGLRKQPVMVEGVFSLKRISLLDKLY